MTRLFLTLLACAFLFTSCETEDITDPVQVNPAFVNSIIGIEENGDVTYTMDKEILLKAAKDFAKEGGVEIDPIWSDIQEIDGKKFLRIYSEQDIVSTVELITDTSMRLFVGETMCTSVACASGGGCVPDGLYCTKCTIENGPYAPDCKRTTSGIGIDVR